MRVGVEKNQQSFWGALSWSLAALFFLYEFFLRVFPGTLSKLLISQFGLNAYQLALLGSSYYAAYALLQIPIGYLIGIFGVRKILIVALLICLTGNLIFALSFNYISLFLSRVLMGIGSAAAFPSMLIIVKDWFSHKRYGFFAGMTQILGGIGAILAGVPLILAVQLYDNHWQIPLIFVCSAGFLLFILSFIFLKEKNNQKNQEIDMYKISDQVRYLLANRQVRFIAFYALASYAAIPLFGATWGVLYLQTIGLSHAKAAMVISSMWFGLAIGSPSVGYISDLLNRKKEILIFCSFLAALVTLIIIYILMNYLFLLILFFLLGLSGSAQTLSFVVLERFVPANLYPCAVGINNTAVMLGGTIIPLLIGFGFNLVEYFTGEKLIYSIQNFRMLLLIVPVLLITGLIIAVIYIPDHKKLKRHQIEGNYEAV